MVPRFRTLGQESVQIMCPQKKYYAFLFDNKLYFYIHK